MEFLTKLLACFGLNVLYWSILIAIAYYRGFGVLDTLNPGLPKWIRRTDANIQLWWLDRSNDLGGLFFVLIVVFCLFVGLIISHS